jgi:hypothetical protein
VLNYTRDLRAVKWVSTVILRSGNSQRRMSALGEERTSRRIQPMSLFPKNRHSMVRFVPTGNIAAYFNRRFSLRATTAVNAHRRATCLDAALLGRAPARCR